MSVTRRYTSADLEGLPRVEGTRYEIIDGELHGSTAPRYEHQYACVEIIAALRNWSHRSGEGVTLVGPGLVFAADQDVIPDLVWFSRGRLATALDDKGNFRVAPELVVEVLSPGSANERRDRELKLRLYERQGVQEYWIVSWPRQCVEVYRRGEARREGPRGRPRGEEGLPLVAALTGEDVLTTPLLPDFACPLSMLWAPAI